MTIDKIQPTPLPAAVETKVTKTAEEADKARALTTQRTLDNNQLVANDLQTQGLTVNTSPSQHALKAPAPLIFFSPTTHDRSTRFQGAFGEQLRWTWKHSRRGPRVAIRQAVAHGSTATVTWLAPDDEDVTGFQVESQGANGQWSVAAQVGPTESSATAAIIHARITIGPPRSRLLRTASPRA